MWMSLTDPQHLIVTLVAGIDARSTDSCKEDQEKLVEYGHDYVDSRGGADSKQHHHSTHHHMHSRAEAS